MGVQPLSKLEIKNKIRQTKKLEYKYKYLIMWINYHSLSGLRMYINLNISSKK